MARISQPPTLSGITQRGEARIASLAIERIVAKRQPSSASGSHLFGDEDRKKTGADHSPGDHWYLDFDVVLWTPRSSSEMVTFNAMRPWLPGSAGIRVAQLGQIPTTPLGESLV